MEESCRRLMTLMELQNILLLLLLLLYQKIHDFFLHICLEELTAQYVRTLAVLPSNTSMYINISVYYMYKHFSESFKKCFIHRQLFDCVRNLDSKFRETDV
jgi:hypothetical protein